MRPLRRIAAGLACGLLVCAGCATPYDYTAYRQHMPRSILVLPPLNESVEANAPYSYITTVSRPLAERGYYVFPVSVIDAFMKDNGLPTPGEMHGVSLRKLDEVIGPDAVLYITIVQWGQKYRVLSSNTEVALQGRLVDVSSGTTIWTGGVAAVEGSGGSGSLFADLIIAAVDQAIDASTDASRPLAQQANVIMMYDQNKGLLVGPLHPKFGVTDED